MGLASGISRRSRTFVLYPGPGIQEGLIPMSEIVRGAAIKGVTRPSKRFKQGRVCAQKGCETKLSQYNKAEYCHAHAPIRFPRVRGKILDDA